jgi:tetratricopeptide (TPR) repeat protein
MKRTLFIFIMAMALLSLLSCREDNAEQQLLDSIEQTWQQCERSLSEAQMRAGRMRDSVRKSSEYVRQKYNLLTIRLRDKCDAIPSSPDSATQALTYFANRKNAVDKERAYYYAGSAYRDLKDYPRAVSHFLTAVDIAKQSKAADTVIWQNSLSQLRYLYMLGLNYEEELNVALQAVELAKGGENGNGESRRNLGCYLMDAASAYHHLNDTLHCLQYCDQAYKVICEEGFPPKYGRVLSYMMAIYSKYNHYEKIDTLLLQLKQLPENQRPNNYEICIAQSYEKANNTDSAILHYKNYYDKEKSIVGRYEASAGLQRCYLQKGDSRQAAQWGCRLYETNDSIIAQRAFEQTQRARNEYIYHRDKEAEEAIKQRDERIIFISTVSVLSLLSIVLGLMAFYSFRRKKFMEEIVDKDQLLKSKKEEILWRTQELEQKKQEIEQLSQQLNDAEQTIAASKVQFENALKDLEQRTMVNKELTRIALLNNATDKAEDIIDYFRKVSLGQAILKAGSWKELMVAIETLYPGFLETVQERMHGQLREPLLYTICLMKIGLKPIQIARVMDAKIQTVWNRVKRAEEICGDLLRWQS